MANTINNISDVGKVIAKIGATMLADNCQFFQSCDKEPASTFSQVNGYNVGQTVTINKPARPNVGTTADITGIVGSLVEEKVNMTLDQRFVTSIELTSAEIQNTLALKDWSKRVMEPYISGMAQNIDSSFLTLAKNATYNNFGTPGSSLYDTSMMGDGRRTLKKNLVPGNKLLALLESDAMNKAVTARKGLFNASPEIAKQYKTGYMATADGFDYLESNLLPYHTRGTQAATGATVTTTLSGEGVAIMNVTGTSGGTLLKGDTFTIAGIFMVHPITKVTTTQLQQFVVLANNTAVSTAYTGVTFSPAIYTSATATLQNVSGFPQSTNAITFQGTASTAYQQNLVYGSKAFRVASVPLMKPEGADMVGQETVDGMTLRVWRDANIYTDKMILRLDFLGAFCAVRPEWAARAYS